MTDSRVSIQLLPNGLWRLQDRASGLSGCYGSDGRYRHGDLRLDGFAVIDSNFNRANYPNRIGTFSSQPISYAQVIKLTTKGR